MSDDRYAAPIICHTASVRRSVVVGSNNDRLGSFPFLSNNQIRNFVFIKLFDLNVIIGCSRGKKEFSYTF